MIDEKKHRILKEENFIDYPKYKNSIEKLIEKHPDGVSDEVIAKVLNITKEEVEEIYNSAIEKIKKNAGI